MSFAAEIITTLCVFVLTYTLTGGIRNYALTRELVDVPNKRSSHNIVTPRGGGLSFVITFNVSLLAYGYLNNFDSSFLIGVLGSGVLISLVGFIDDHRHIAAHWRLIVHFLAAIWVLFCFGGFPLVKIGGIQYEFHIVIQIIAAFYLVWLLNLYNFMDGIDGIASLEAITVCLGGIVLYWLAEPTGNTWIVPALLLAAVAGFLPWNFPQAKIFMGDAGSGFLGLMLGALSIQAAWIAAELFWSWLILLGVFLVDSTVTLVRRILRKEKFYEAHCSHAYQHAARQFGSHIPVSISVGFINLLWLLPIAVLVALNYLDGIAGLLIACIPLIILAFYFKAGVSDEVSDGLSE